MAYLATEIDEMELAGPLSAGNVSVLADNTCYITPSGVPLGSVLEDQVVEWIGVIGTNILPPPSASSEWRIHQECYASRASITTVVHTHQPWATALSSMGFKKLPFVHYYQALLGDPYAPVIPFQLPGSEALALEVRDVLDSNREAEVLVLENHGALITGRDIRDVIRKAEALEVASEIVVRTWQRNPDNMQPKVSKEEWFQIRQLLS